MFVNWNKCQGNVWCKLNSVNIDHPHFNSMSGVYIIWHGGDNPRTVYVGHGFIRGALFNAIRNVTIQNYEVNTLYVTWAEVSPNQQFGVERYLINVLNPLINPSYYDPNQIQVNLPW